MCTSLTLPTPDGYKLFGRTLDLDAHFGEGVILTPKGYPFCFGGGYPQTHHYAMVGMAAEAEGYPLYAEAMNEAGLCIAGLRFAGNAAYADRPETGWLNLAPWELIPYLLCNYTTVSEVRAALGEIRVVDRPVSTELPTSPLHWHIADRDPAHGELVVEVTARGMAVYDNPVGVLTNNPPFPYQLARLGDYAHLSPIAAEATVTPPDCCCASLGTGAVGLPGDYSSPSRFVRAAILRRWAVAWMEQNGAAGEDPTPMLFSLLGAVSPTVGAVLTREGKAHRTLYTCCMDGTEGVYRYRAEGETGIRQASFAHLNRDGKALIRAT